MNSNRFYILRLTVLLLFGVIIIRLIYIQIIDNNYKNHADNNVLRYEVLFPPRGEVFDRNGEFLVQSKESYDLMATPKEVKPFDTLLMSQILGVPIESITRELKKAHSYSRSKPSVIVKQLPKEVKLRMEERHFPGFFLIYRTVRSYPKKIAGNLLGYVGEVNNDMLQKDPYYRIGDYIGMSGIERSYEEVLRGEKGFRINMVDVLGASKGSYRDGIYDTLPQRGSYITCTIDSKLQALGEYLLEGKVGSIVAIEPQTGEILIMASSPTYNPDELLGRERGNNYMKLLNNKQRPLFNRAVQASYPPGSTFKLVTGLIGLQEKVLQPSQLYSCHGGYTVGRGVKCHSHWSPLNLPDAVQTSCNAYFCYVFRNIIDNRKYGGVKSGLKVWEDYVRSFGFGRKLNTDFSGELNGNLPSPKYYDDKYKTSWNSLTVVSLSIGQGEMGCTPMQMANLAATVANRGYYYIPHVVKAIEDRESIDTRFLERHRTMVDSIHFIPIIEGMYNAVHKAGGTAQVAKVPGLDICGKTGTSQNPHGKDHSTFLCFAPRENPKIAISVYIENGGFGATIAAPIASLIVEQHLTDTIKRPDLVQRMHDIQLAYPHYAK